MSDSDVKSIALFFFFTMLDEKRALHASSQAFDLCVKKIGKKPQTSMAMVVVMATQEIWDQHRKRFHRGRPQYSLDSGWKTPDGLDFNSWKDFQKKAPEEELLSLVWSQILKFSDEDIAAGLGVTQGTVRFRVGRALRKLGGSGYSMSLGTLK